MAFVRSACPLVKNYIRWDLQWKGTFKGSEKRVRDFLDELSSTLEEIYGDGSWSLSRIESIQSKLEPRMLSTLIRRYMDGGPELIAALQDCVKDIYDVVPAPIRPDPRATLAISKIVPFEQVKLKSGLREIQTDSMDVGAFYRLTHRWNAEKPLPAGIYFLEPSPPNDSWYHYLKALNGSSWDLQAGMWSKHIVSLLQQMTALDPAHKYRSLNRSEFSELLKTKRLSKSFKRFCLFEKNALTQETVLYIGRPNGSTHPVDDLDEDGGYRGTELCPYDSVRFVRETK